MNCGLDWAYHQWEDDGGAMRTGHGGHFAAVLIDLRLALLNVLEAKLSQFRCIECGAIDQETVFIGPFPFCRQHLRQGLAWTLPASK